MVCEYAVLLSARWVNAVSDARLCATVGSVEPLTQPMWVFDEGDKFVHRAVTFVPGLYKIFDEILVNAADNKQNDPSMSKIDVIIDQAAGTISVLNDGAWCGTAKHRPECPHTSANTCFAWGRMIRVHVLSYVVARPWHSCRDAL